MWFLPLSLPSPPLHFSPVDLAQFKVCRFLRLTVPKDKETGGSFAAGKKPPGQGRGWGWTPESLSLEQLIGFPLYREEQKPCTPTLTLLPPSGARSLQHILHP